MKLPDLQGTFDQSDFFIYAACDSVYFADFGTAFVNSIKRNTDCNIHIHLFNPTPDQIEYCQRNGVGITWEYAHQNLFAAAAHRWMSVPIQEPDKSRYERTVNAMQKGHDASILERIQKTYYACARFIRLSQLCDHHRLLAVDVDAIVRTALPELDAKHDFYMHHIPGRRARFLAGGIWLNGTLACQQFLADYAGRLQQSFEQDYVYWGLDQDLLDPVVPRYNHGQLPMSYIDWNMRPDSHIWTAKGTRKELAVFVNEQKKYTAV